MTDNTKPEALDLADWLEAVGGGQSTKRCAALLREQHARIAELEAQLEAVGAGGVQALSAAPAGWKLVPEDATEEMVRATDKVNFASADADGTMHNVWNVMLAASPTPPAEQQATKETSGGFHVWRDISTAPKDGSRFVATGHNYGLYSEVRHACVAQWFRGCWIEASDWNETSELKYLTHWMPLPSPPDDVAAPAEQQAAPKAAPAAVGHDEDLLEKLYWEFDSQRKKTGEDRLAFKVKMRFYASEFLRRSDGKMTFAQSVSDDMMNLADRLGSEFDDVDPRAWRHLLVYAPQQAPVVGRMSPSKEWLETRLAIADDSDVQAGVPSKNARPCDAPPGCDSHNCHGCDDFKHPSPTPQPAPAPLSDDTKRLAWMADEWTPGHEKLYDKHVLETGGVGGLDDLRTFIDKQIAAQEGKT